MPTKDELEAENARLRAELDELRTAGPAAPAPPPAPKRPEGPDGKPILSAGERDDLVNAGVTTSPFTGEALDAITEGVEPGNPDARRAAERAHAKLNPTAAGDTPAAE